MSMSTVPGHMFPAAVDCHFNTIVHACGTQNREVGIKNKSINWHPIKIQLTVS